MAIISVNTELDIKIDGKNFQVPREYFDFSVKVTYGDNEQPNISFTELTLIGDARLYILDWIKNGLTGGVGIFEGIPITLSVRSKGSSLEVFNGLLDLQDNLIIDDDNGQLTVNLKQDNALNNLEDLVSPLDYSFLYQNGDIKDSDFIDVDYVVVNPDPAVESALIFVTGYLLAKQLQDSIKELSDVIAEVASAIAGGITGSIAAAILAAAKAVALAVYSAALLLILLHSGLDLIEIITQPQRTHKGTYLKTLLEKAFLKIGYKLNTSISELNNIVYLPSNKNTDIRNSKSIISQFGTIEAGIPFVSDFGHTVTEMLELVRLLFNARFFVDKDTIQVHSANSDFWVKRASYNKVPTIPSSFRYNTNEMISSLLVSFNTDITDKFTIDNYKGTSYQVLTDAKVINEKKRKTIKNSSQINIPLALGSRKNELSGFDEVISSFAGVFDDLVKVFGGSSDIKSNIENKVGTLQVSNNNHTIPKLLWLESGRLPLDHREKFNAKILYDKYWNYTSLVNNDFNRQSKIYEGVNIPFGFSDFTRMINNSYFYNEAGLLCESIGFTWSTLSDRAVISYKEPYVYTKNLKETFIEQS